MDDRKRTMAGMGYCGRKTLKEYARESARARLRAALRKEPTEPDVHPSELPCEDRCCASDTDRPID